MSEWVSGKIDFAENLRKHEARAFAIGLRELVIPSLSGFEPYEQQKVLEIEIERLLKAHDAHTGDMLQRAHDFMQEANAVRLIPQSIIVPVPEKES